MLEELGDRFARQTKQNFLKERSASAGEEKKKKEPKL